MLESAAAYCVGVVSGPTTAVPEPGVAVPGSGVTTEVPEPPADVPWPTIEVPRSPAWFFEPAASGSGGMKMESDSGDGLIDGLRRRWRETPVGMACRVEPIRARVC